MYLVQEVLDIPSMEALERTLLEYPGTLLFVSHDKRFRDKVATRTLELENGRLKNPEALPKKTVNADKVLLDMRRTRLVEELGSAQGEQKNTLEQEYQEVLAQLQMLKNDEIS